MNIFQKLIIITFIILIGAVSYFKFVKKVSFYRIFSRLFVTFTFSSLIFIILFVIINGMRNFRPDLLSLNYTSDNVSMGPAIFATIMVVFFSLVIAAPIGIFTAIYLVEYRDNESKLVNLIRLATETLSGIPSIVYGLFGMILFTTVLNLGFSIVSGALTSSIMILPIIIRSTEEALKVVHPSIRSGSFALGAGKLRTIFKVVLPVSIPGILSGVILAIGRVIGETAALMYTLGTATSFPKTLLSSSRTLAVHMYMLSSEGFHTGEAYATGMVLLILILVINFLSTRLAKKLMEVK